MARREQRKFIRYDSLHLLDYIILDDKDRTTTYSMGRTIDVSIDGIKLETHIPITTNSKLLITVGLEDDLIELEGQATHEAMGDGRYTSGVSFLKITKDGRRILTKYVEAFHRRQRELALAQN